jgi:hypothetical protein
MSDQFTVYVDPLKSLDEIIAKGNKENPFHDLFSAFLAHPPESRVPPHKFLILDAGSAEWRPATKSALKKAVSRYDKHTKKVHTLGEEEELRQARQAALIEARKFVPKSDSSLPVPVNMKNFARHQDHVILGDDITTGTRLRVVGRVDNIRKLYLETQLPILGDCYTIQSSFRAERALTLRNLSEYTNVEGELDFIIFDDLLDHIEDLLCGVIDILLANEERAMTSSIGVPIMLTHFPSPIKAFYMKKVARYFNVTESVEVLVPGVGEVVGGGMRADNLEDLLAVIRANGWIDNAYALYSDQRK